ncbi:tetratricopeptide repeat protein [Desulfovibrio sp. OttesenSCG-928-M16]|nr:tetratricopeptide repeat protein [Desulfovibrio sp. OttesenSCG-928-M16]
MRYLAYCTLIALLNISCSSLQSKPAEITESRDTGKTQLQLANQEIDRGRFSVAGQYLERAWLYAVQNDDPELRIKVRLTRGNVAFYQSRKNEARQDWNAALAEAEHEAKSELVAIVKVYVAWGTLLEAMEDGNADVALIQGLQKVFERERENITSDRLSLALTWTGSGLAAKELRQWERAEAALKKALEIHEGGNYLIQAAYDWFLIASVRSQAGQYPQAVEALKQALALDRRAENSNGLSFDWTALGEVYDKMGDYPNAQKARQRAKEITKAAAAQKDLSLLQ